MRKKILILIASLFFLISVQGQTWETIGSGVADFLLSNPKTANRMNTDQQVALNIIGNLLKNAGARKHDINVAEAGKTEINLSTNTGQHIQLVVDANGAFYALSNGKIYPISNNIVKEAEDYVLNQQSGYMNYVKNNTVPVNDKQLMLPDYNYSKIKNEWDSKKPTSRQNIIMHKSPLYISDILNIFEVTKKEIYVWYRKALKPIEEPGLYSKYISNKLPLRPLKIKKVKYATVIKGLFNKSYIYLYLTDTYFRGAFVAKWLNDINKDGRFEFEEFQDLRRNFYENEPFLIAAGMYSQYFYNIRITVLNQQTGKIVYENIIHSSNEKIDSGCFKFEAGTFNPGMYVFNISIIRTKTNEELKKISDKFQILAINQSKHIEKKDRPVINTNINKFDSKEKMISDLIQLLKDGKISEETFKVSMKAIENNN
ncbi:MAG: hypothetical protein PF484_11355 [Bacteroidales bacterium]|jgi:hypothetical protein|nr:hypothetical protein [Bacteroidales bacterium]